MVSMDITPYVENLRRDLAVAADAGGEEARALAERLTAPLESAVRLMLLDALSAAADEITRELAPGSVELRLRAGEPEFAVTPAAGRRAGERRRRRPRARRAEPTRARRRASTSACPSSSRPTSSRRRAASGMSVNAWLVRSAAAALAHDDRGRGPRAERRPHRPGLHRLGAMTAPYFTDRGE